MTAVIWADSATNQEYRVKAAFLYNFLKFVDWPEEEKEAEKKMPVVIGIMGKDPFSDAFESLKGKQVKNRAIMVKHFKGFDELQKLAQDNKEQYTQIVGEMRKCYLLFICASERQKQKEILSIIKDHPVLTVADTDGFLDVGGMMNLVMEDRKVRFEIAVKTAEKAKLKIRSQLLRLAKNVKK